MKRGRTQQSKKGKKEMWDRKMDPIFSNINETHLKNSLLQNPFQSEMIPILSVDEIKKLETLKRESINIDKIQINPRTSIRPPMRASLRHSGRQSKYESPPKTKVKKKGNTEEDTNTKKTDETNITSKSTKRRKEKAIKEKEEGFLDRCCDMFEQKEKKENPFRRARESYLKN